MDQVHNFAHNRNSARSATIVVGSSCSASGYCTCCSAMLTATMKSITLRLSAKTPDIAPYFLNQASLQKDCFTGLP